MDGIVKRRAGITQQDPGNVEDAMKENEPGGRNRQRVTRNTEHDSCHVEGTLEEEMIPLG